MLTAVVAASVLWEVSVDPKQIDGEWWVPESPDRKVSGTLSISANGDMELRLFEPLRDEFYGIEPTVSDDGSAEYRVTSEAMAARGRYQRILGTSDSSGYTLDDCLSTHRTSNFFGGRGAERIHVGRMLKNVHFAGDEPLRFTEFVVRMQGLALWTALSGMKESLQYKTRANSDQIRVLGNTLAMSRLPTKRFNGPDSSRFRLAQIYTVRGGDGTDRGFAEDFYFGGKHSDLIELEDLLAEASALQDLVTIATGRAAAFTSVSLRHPNVFRRHGRRKQPIPIEMTAQWVVQAPEGKKELRRHELWFTLKDFGGVGTISNWLDVALANRSTLSRVMTTKYSSGMYTTDHLFNCAAALEAYDREKTATGTYLTRINRCIELADAPFADLVGDTGAWARRFRDARNDVAHHNVGIAGASTEQYILSRSAFWLFVLCLFRDAGVPGATFAKLQEHQDWHWLKGQVATMLAD